MPSFLPVTVSPISLAAGLSAALLASSIAPQAAAQPEDQVDRRGQPAQQGQKREQGEPSRPGGLRQAEPRVEIGIGEEDRRAIAERLQGRLSDLYVLYTKTWNYHWNVTGRDFYQLHELFGEQYEQMAMQIDVLAERIRALGYYPQGSLAAFRARSEIPDAPDETPSAAAMIQDLLRSHEQIVQTLREDFEPVGDAHGDLVTQDLLIDAARAHAKMAWMLRAHLVEQR